MRAMVLGLIVAAAAAAPTAETPPPNASHGRALLQHETTRGGSFCLGGRLVPLFFLFGCQRCGGTAMYYDIMKHVRGAREGRSIGSEPAFYEREQHFYASGSPSSSTWDRGISHYTSHFVACPPNSAGFEFSIDATAAYMRKPVAAERIPQMIPQGAHGKLRFVVVLRDPTDRLYAYWDAFVLGGKGMNNFDIWVKGVMEKVKTCQNKNGDQLWPPPDNCDEDTVQGVAAGLCAYQLIYWLHRFDPSQFFLTSFHAYQLETGKVLRDVARFFGASESLTGTVANAGDLSSVKVMGGMSNEARKTLGKFYKPHNAQLLHTLNTNAKMTFSPSLKALAIQGWRSGD